MKYDTSKSLPKNLDEDQFQGNMYLVFLLAISSFQLNIRGAQVDCKSWGLI